MDCDVSPMHLGRLPARLLGFKGTVGNVHCVTAFIEAALMRHGVIPQAAQGGWVGVGRPLLGKVGAGGPLLVCCTGRARASRVQASNPHNQR